LSNEADFIEKKLIVNLLLVLCKYYTMLKTPPSSTRLTNCFETPPSSPRLINCFESPPQILFQRDEGESPLKRQKLISSQQSPRKPIKKKVLKVIPGLPILNDEEMKMIFNVNQKIGSGSFGNVYSIQLRANAERPESPSFAMKIISPGNRTCHKDLVAEASNFCKDGCIHGFGMSKPDGTYLGFSPIANPLSKMEINSENIEEIIRLTCEAIEKAPIEVVNDANMDNMGYIPEGTRVIILDENGLPDISETVIPNNTVRMIDLGQCEAPEDANPKYTALIPIEKMVIEDDIRKFRRFKCDMMEALLQNKILSISEQSSHQVIVSKICKKYEYQYAGGEI
jgi:hypothetical protein